MSWLPVLIFAPVALFVWVAFRAVNDHSRLKQKSDPKDDGDGVPGVVTIVMPVTTDGSSAGCFDGGGGGAGGGDCGAGS